MIALTNLVTASVNSFRGLANFGLFAIALVPNNRKVNTHKMQIRLNEANTVNSLGCPKVVQTTNVRKNKKGCATKTNQPILGLFMVCWAAAYAFDRRLNMIDRAIIKFGFAIWPNPPNRIEDIVVILLGRAIIFSNRQFGNAGNESKIPSVLFIIPTRWLCGKISILFGTSGIPPTTGLIDSS